MSDENPIISAYRAFSPASYSLSEQAKKVFPGGDTRASAHYSPYPLSIDHAQGCILTDADGNQILDFMNNFTSLIHGHAHPAVVEAVQTQIAKGSAYAAPSDAQIELAQLITERVPSVEQMRFTSSGTEGTTMAIRCARAATGRQKIMKMEGGYHGSFELAEVSLVPYPKLRGELTAPNATAVDDSFPDSVLGDTVVCPYNQPDIASQLISAHHEELAAVIVEPILGSMGMLAASREFLQTLRDATSQYGIVLIFDEVITLRVDQGGAQTTLGITPDLTCMGKIIGGGLPVGAVGGKKELMQLFSPESSRPVMHASTFSGNALTMAAGLAAMQNFDATECTRINALGDRLREGFNQAFGQAGIKGQAVGHGSLSNLHFNDALLNDSRDAMQGMIAAGQFTQLLHLAMLQKGIMSASRLMYCISTAMQASHIDQAVTAFNETLTDLRPYMEQQAPHLLR